MKYLCLAYEEEARLKALSSAEWQALRAETLAYVEDLRQKGLLVSAEPLQSSRKAVTIRVRDGKVNSTDGPFAETKEQLGGFFLIEANSMEQAAEVAASWPSARLGTIEVRPIEAALRIESRY